VKSKAFLHVLQLEIADDIDTPETSLWQKKGGRCVGHTFVIPTGL
jgi:hypothetical protein